MLYTDSADALQGFRLMLDTPAHEGVERGRAAIPGGDGGPQRRANGDGGLHFICASSACLESRNWQGRRVSQADPLTATASLGGPSPRRSEVGYSAPGLVPGQEHPVGKR